MTSTTQNPRKVPRFVEALTNPHVSWGLPDIIYVVERVLARHTKRPPRSESFELTAQAKSA